ncbi:adenylate kinase [Haploplasma modicum]|jgi:adenylate kinase|uniref:adenylate kinase n=1 Tax=Haploplasma modicum TaxID=2150 RepID=UPI00138ADF6F|nr:adenylate kinase [Haploplasma modicum]MCR1808623.1 adenylate kinase [Haploplasma modicum]
MRIILMGPPGVGKGTQAVTLESHLNVPHVSTGDIFRALLRTEDPIGIEVRKYLDHGLLVPDELTNQVVTTRFREQDVHKGFIFDGYPRNVFQAESFDKFLKEHNWTIDAVVNIAAPDEDIIKRLSGRRVCPTCGKTYHLESNKPKVDTLCDVDQTPLIQREDDKPETIKKRLAIYHDQTKPLIEYYSKQGLVITIDGTGTIEKTHDLTIKALGEIK